MPANKKPRKKYRPSPLIGNVMEFVKDSVTPVAAYNGHYVTKWGLLLHSALTDLAEGVGTIESLSTIIASHYVCAALVQRLKLGVEHAPVLKTSADALKAVTSRYKGVDYHTATPEEMDAINALGELHDAFMAMVTVGEIGKAHSIAVNLLRIRTRLKEPLL